jgi:hypothetical protein
MNPKNLARTNTLAYFVQPSVMKERVLKSFALEVKAISPFLFGTNAEIKLVGALVTKFLRLVLI